MKPCERCHEVRLGGGLSCYQHLPDDVVILRGRKLTYEAGLVDGRIHGLREGEVRGLRRAQTRLGTLHSPDRIWSQIELNLDSWLRAEARKLRKRTKEGKR